MKKHQRLDKERTRKLSEKPRRGEYLRHQGVLRYLTTETSAAEVRAGKRSIA